MEYTYTEEPAWRTSGSKTSELLKDITDFATRYEKLPESAKTFCEKEFASSMAIDCIYHLNIGELVGTQSQDDTKQVLEALLSSNPSPTTTSTDKTKRSHLETMNTYLAMKKLYEIRKDMDQSGLLTVDQICDVHRVLLDGLHNNNGSIRTTEVYTPFRNGTHFYPPPTVVEQRLYALVDRHNIYVDSSPSNLLSEEHFSHVFKYAARLLFEFVDTHPFADGNGRMCRLLANHAISHITPFPVGLYHSGRDDFINAIVKCRENPEDGPGDLAALLIEGAWMVWKSFFWNLERRDQLKPGVRVGPIVVQKSKPATIVERVNRIWPSIEKNGVLVDKETVVKAIEGATREANVNTSEPCRCIQTARTFDSVTVLVEVFP